MSWCSADEAHHLNIKKSRRPQNAHGDLLLATYHNQQHTVFFSIAKGKLVLVQGPNEEEKIEEAEAVSRYLLKRFRWTVSVSGVSIDLNKVLDELKECRDTMEPIPNETIEKKAAWQWTNQIPSTNAHNGVRGVRW
jgi:hypothetical protein